ncbi:MAG: zinc ABC transporter substrate-binding protein [Deltaproteobacteria bacterium]|nr:zinc ABC transporter substrate-binding protein [Deltaproteobacteria bacterium]
MIHALLAAIAVAAPAKPLQVGVTLHPYYSWVSNVVQGTPVKVIPILPGEIDAGNYQPGPREVATLQTLDALVVNGIGHDDFVPEMVKASGNTHLTLIKVNDGTPLMPGAHGEAVNSHTFLSFTNAIQQTYLIARLLGTLRPELADTFMDNAHAYARRLRAIKAAAAAKLVNPKVTRVVTVHDGYSYLMQELGIEIAGVVQPSHGLTPSAAELQQMIDLMKREKLQVVLTEESFPAPLLKTLQDATGARVFIISHVATGTYAPDEFEKAMQKNVDTLVLALAGPGPEKH